MRICVEFDTLVDAVMGFLLHTKVLSWKYYRKCAILRFCHSYLLMVVYRLLSYMYSAAINGHYCFYRCWAHILASLCVANEMHAMSYGLSIHFACNCMFFHQFWDKCPFSVRSARQNTDLRTITFRATVYHENGHVHVSQNDAIACKLDWQSTVHKTFGCDEFNTILYC